MHDGWTDQRPWSGAEAHDRRSQAAHLLHAFTVESDSLIGLDPAKVLPHPRGSGGQIHGLQAPAFGRQAFDEAQGCDDEQHGQEAQ